MEVISNYRDKKLVEYLKPGMSVKILFNDHGMGDCVMFMPLYNRLKELYKDVHFNLQCNKGQEYFQEIDTDKYDHIFYIKFPQTYFMEWRERGLGKSKPELCAAQELGIPFDASIEFSWKPDKPNTDDLQIAPNTIGVCFQVTSNPRKGLSQSLAKVVWDTIKAEGFTPLEVQFDHALGNQTNKKFSFIDNTCRQYTPCVQYVIEAVRKCKGFIGVNTGAFCTAVSLLDGKVLHLWNCFPFQMYKRYNPVMQAICRNGVDTCKIKEYLSNL